MATTARGAAGLLYSSNARPLCTGVASSGVVISMLVLTCDCGNRLKVADNAIGKSGRCPKCNTVLTITTNNTSPFTGRPSASATVNPAEVMAKGAGGIQKKKIGELLLEAGLITEGQLRDALDVQQKRGGKLVEQLISLGHIDPDAFVRFLANQPGVASLDLAHYKISDEIVELIPAEMCIEHEIFPIDRLGKLLTVGMVCPLDSATIRKLEELTGLRVKPILCSPADIRRAIQEHFRDALTETLRSGAGSGGAKPPTEENVEQAASAMKLQRVSTLLKELEALPALPQTVARVREAMGDIQKGARDVAQVVQQDPAVAAKVLSVANSAAYGFPNRVDSIELAVALLGLKETYSIVTSAAVMSLFENGEHQSYQKFWDEALACAAAARRIAKVCKLDNQEGTFTAGLLHDIGRIAFLETVPHQYKDVSPDLVGDALVEAEMEVLGISHTEAGYELAVNWNLPAEIAEAIRFHHSPEFAEIAPKQVAVVALAEFWTRTHPAATSNKDEVLGLTPDLFKTLGMKPKAVSDAYDQVAELETVRFAWADKS